uniref:Secreted protein n=1 Tax=Ixodes ricinus TaxID=34613 RepID=A0A6B0V798_IXORI
MVLVIFRCILALSALPGHLQLWLVDSLTEINGFFMLLCLCQPADGGRIGLVLRSDSGVCSYAEPDVVQVYFGKKFLVGDACTSTPYRDDFDVLSRGHLPKHNVVNLTCCNTGRRSIVSSIHRVNPRAGQCWGLFSWHCPSFGGHSVYGDGPAGAIAVDEVFGAQPGVGAWHETLSVQEGQPLLAQSSVHREPVKSVDDAAACLARDAVLLAYLFLEPFALLLAVATTDHRAHVAARLLVFVRHGPVGFSCTGCKYVGSHSLQQNMLDTPPLRRSVPHECRVTPS